VLFAPLDAATIERYVATGEADDKAGAYALQGIAGFFVEAIEGSPSNVVGLPVRLLYTLAARLGVDLLPRGR
jgi:septum formation protein